MKALVFETNGEPDNVLRLCDLADPVPGPREVVVRVLLAPVHPSDLHIIRGRFGRQPQLPASPGIECVGIIETVGSHVIGLSIGIRVILLGVLGTWRERIACAAERVVPIPELLSDDDAAQAVVNPLTACVLILAEHQLQRDDWLIQTGAGSTVGRLVLQLARIRGFKTINIVRRVVQRREIEALGGDVVISTEDKNWPAQLVSATRGLNVTKAVDCVGGWIGANVERALAPGSRMLVYGALSSYTVHDRAANELALFAPSLIYNACTVQRWFLYHWLDEVPLAEAVSTLRCALEYLASGGLRLPGAVRYPMSRIKDAIADSESGSLSGRALLSFDDAGRRGRPSAFGEDLSHDAVDEVGE
jgi:NADPH:quinone reductase-like Zn-dependent oxidoreductase